MLLPTRVHPAPVGTDRMAGACRRARPGQGRPPRPLLLNDGPYDDHLIDAEVSDLSKPENRFERPWGLLEVYLPIQTPSGTPVQFEAYYVFARLRAPGRGAATG